MDALHDNLISANDLLSQYLGFDNKLSDDNTQTKIQVKNRIEELEEIIVGIKNQIFYWQQKDFEKGE